MDLKISIESLKESDLQQADFIMRFAFGTFLGMPDPLKFMGDANYVVTRWNADRGSTFGAIVNNELSGSVFVSNWGSVGFFGPLTIHPKYWNQGLAQRLMEPVLECFSNWKTKNAGLFTFADSQKHINLYQKFGFWPWYLTSIMTKFVAENRAELQWSKLSDGKEGNMEEMITECKLCTDAIYDGLEVSMEIRSVAAQKLWETILLWDEGKLAGLAICHCGQETEAGSGNCYIKFGAVLPGHRAGKNFACLIEACENMAKEKDLTKLVAGVNTARQETYKIMLNNNFKVSRYGIAMQRPNESDYNRPDSYIIDY